MLWLVKMNERNIYIVFKSPLCVCCVHVEGLTIISCRPEPQTEHRFYIRRVASHAIVAYNTAPPSKLLYNINAATVSENIVKKGKTNKMKPNKRFLLGTNNG